MRNMCVTRRLLVIAVDPEGRDGLDKDQADQAGEVVGPKGLYAVADLPHSYGMAQPGFTVNKSEEFVLGICQRSVLSLWCYNNPIGEPGKELCDILVVCDPHVIIVSVKDIRLREGDLAVEHGRWERKAIDDSVKQIYGAERRLMSLSQVIRSDGSPGLNLPPVAQRKIHRLAVAFGGRGEGAITSGDFGKGLVHVMSEHSFLEVLSELDTITDMVEYLTAKEEFTGRCAVVIEGSEAESARLVLVPQSVIPNGHGPYGR